MTRRLLSILSLAAVGYLATSCQSRTTAGTGRTEHERDSVIGQSKLPGAPVVQKALDVADSSRNRVAQEDSAAAAP
ncbi:MAG TPA: hypothetical protein VN719_17345 [Gemmatimonadales bacterium]|nr:hypothetical protein [Gemmatimonadales bacterium]